MHKLEWVALGLVLLAQLTWGGESPLLSWLGFVPFVATLAAWAAYHLSPGVLAKVPGWPADRSLEVVAGLLLVLAALRAGFFFGFLLQVAAVVVLWRAVPPAPPGTERVVDVGRLWRSGWTTRLTAVGLLLLGLSLGSAWHGAATTTTTTTIGDYDYINTHQWDALDAYDEGFAWLFGIALAVAVAVMVVPRLARHPIGLLVALGALGVAGIRAVWIAIEDWQWVREMNELNAYPDSAFGPVLFVFLLIPTTGLLLWSWWRTRRPAPAAPATSYAALQWTPPPPAGQPPAGQPAAGQPPAAQPPAGPPTA